MEGAYPEINVKLKPLTGSMRVSKDKLKQLILNRGSSGSQHFNSKVSIDNVIELDYFVPFLLHEH